MVADVMLRPPEEREGELEREGRGDSVSVGQREGGRGMRERRERGREREEGREGERVPGFRLYLCTCMLQ